MLHEHVLSQVKQLQSSDSYGGGGEEREGGERDRRREGERKTGESEKKERERERTPPNMQMANMVKHLFQSQASARVSGLSLHVHKTS